jgi:hypothetical protein
MEIPSLGRFIDFSKSCHLKMEGATLLMSGFISKIKGNGLCKCLNVLLQGANSINLSSIITTFIIFIIIITITITSTIMISLSLLDIENVELNNTPAHLSLLQPSR